jgi:hypothetical protein
MYWAVYGVRAKVKKRLVDSDVREERKTHLSRDTSSVVENKTKIGAQRIFGRVKVR